MEPASIEDLKRVCRWSVLGPQFYKDDYSFDQCGRLAKAVLYRETGIVAKVNGDTAAVTFHEPEVQETKVSEATT